MEKPDTIKLENSEVRLNSDDGTVDEIVVCDAHGNCLFHMEQMNDQCFWMALYATDKATEPVYVNIFTKNGRSHLTAKVND